MLRGLATVSYFADDVAQAAAWYAQVLGIEPYFARPVDGPPVYVEFRVGDHEDELGIIDRRFARHAVPGEPSGAVIYWHVDDVEATRARLLELGAMEVDPVTTREAGFVTASVADPFGNLIGLMHNPHWLEMLKGR